MVGREISHFCILFIFGLHGYASSFLHSSDQKYVSFVNTNKDWSSNPSDWTSGGGSGDGAFDISQANASGGDPATYNNLAAAILGTNVPEGVRAGGMSVKYIENVYADYGVVVTEGLETQPTGTALQSAPSITDGVYKASQLSAFSTLPPTVGASNTYYIAVTGDTTTYTKWVVTKMTADSEKYVQYRLMATAWSTNVDDWQGVDETPKENSHNLLESGCMQIILDVEPPKVALNQVDLSNKTIIQGYINKTTNKIVLTPSSTDNKVVLLPLKNGETIYYDVYSPIQNYGFLGNYVDNDDCQCLAVGTGQRENSSYTATADMIFAVGVNKTQSPVFRKVDTKYGNSKVINDIKEDLSSVKAAVSVLDITETKTIGYTDIHYTRIEGYRINASGISVLSNYSITDWIFFKAGTEIKIKASNAASNYTLAKKDRYVFPDKVYPVITGLTTVDTTVVLDEDTYYAACWADSGDFIFQINGSVVEVTSEFVDKVNEELYEVTSDDFSTGRIDGKYLTPEGEKTNVGYPNAAYKIYENIQAGTKVTCTTLTNPALPMILFKGLYETNWEVAANADFGGYKTLEYTTAKNGSIAINSADITYYQATSVNFDSSNIESNRVNINYLLNKDALNDVDYLIQSFEVGHMFDQISVIGDSMSTGSINGEGRFGCSWLSFLAKRWNCTYRRHYSRGGYTTQHWLNNEYRDGLGLFLQDNKIFDAYFIAMGHNDKAAITTGTMSGVGSATDTPAVVTIDDTDPEHINTSVPSGLTFCAYYKAIIEQIREIAPYAMIFCLPEYDTLMTLSSHSEIRQAIIDIVDLYRTNGDSFIFHLETGGVPDTELEYTGHYSAQGYMYIAKRVDEEANKVLYEHRGDAALHLYGGWYLPSDR